MDDLISPGQGTNMAESIKKTIIESIHIKQSLLDDETIVDCIMQISKEMIVAFRGGNKVLLCGNGGSAADAQHIAAELTGKYYLDRASLFAEALHTDTSSLTAIANDYSYDAVFSRLIESRGAKGDVLICITTSGKSKNIVKALEVAKGMGMVTVCLTGQNGEMVHAICDFVVRVPSADTPRIQEAHGMIGHILCELVERELFG